MDKQNNIKVVKMNEREYARAKRQDKESIFDRFFKFLMLFTNIVSTFLSGTFLIIMFALKLKDSWVTVSLGVLLILNLSITIFTFFTYSFTKKSRIIKVSKLAIKIVRLVVTVTNMGLTISMWFANNSGSIFVTIMLGIFTGFYGLVVVIQFAFFMLNIFITSQKKRIAEKINSLNNNKY